MPNIADIIEEYIKTKLRESGADWIIVRRNELAEKFRCVPSQISYVLNTRFSFNRGYIVETRRGGGGFVRIIRVSLKDSDDLLHIIYDKIGDHISLQESLDLIRHLYEENIITKREALIMENVLEFVTTSEREIDAGKYRSLLLKGMLMVLLRHEK